ncbi:Hypothetical protein, putative [Bodo saltans]|uniref:Phytanoyl-CoA dioxygenase n=1 Tax=Bodo saltans TaxID=75058 RepID=A0A0S4IUF3_BODSA|nr:Hypothetical protein, putative [Bodo saltans]|eukprot:CUF92249.1 Hypothetical protein, putative [Bodo saltans]
MSIKEQAHINVISAELLGSVTVAAPSLHTEDGAKAFLAVMDTFGFAVVTDVLTKEQVAVAESLFDDDLRSIVDLPDAEKNTKPCFLPNTGESVARRWSDKHPLGRYNPSFASDYGVPHGRCAWYCRTNQAVHRVFEVLHNNDKELCVGMDNVFFDSSRENHSETAKPDSEIEEILWPHADQSIHAAGGDQPCYQGIVYVWPSSQFTSTTVVWPRSHKDAYLKMMAVRSYSSHFCPLPKSALEDFIAGAVRVVIPSGGMILWNSKLIHQGWNIGPRLAVPICMEPKSRRSSDALERKMTACKEGVPTTHWASLGYFHGCCKEDNGGTKDFPLVFNCHKWMINKAGDVDASVVALL